jgi:DNA-binding transcriptional LysR family regulator
MRRYPPVVLALRRLSQLVVLSEELNFHRAADRLHLTQPALSRSISHLEQEVGAPLVIRSTRSVQLTEVGRRLVMRAQPLLEELDGVVAEAQQAGRQRNTSLRVGFKAGAAGRLLTPTVKTFETEHPDVEVRLSRLEWSDQVDALLDDRVDVAFVWLPTPFSPIVTEVLMSETRCVGISRDHPLATRDHVTTDELADEPVVTSASVPPEIACWWSAIPRPDGSIPPLGPAVASAEEMLEVVARGRGVCFVARSFDAFYGRPDVVFIPVLDLEPAPIALAWRTGDERSILASFRDTALKTARELDDDAPSRKQRQLAR